MIPNLFILSTSGEVLIEKHWVGTTKRIACDVFLEELAKVSKPTELLPIIATPKYYLVHAIRYNLTFLSVLRKESPPLFAIELIHRIVDVMADYFKKLNETVTKENFSTIYQLLDEMIDGGFAFMTDENQLKQMIPPPSFTGKVLQSFSSESAVRHALPGGAMTKIPWRRSDVKYIKNEIYFDIVEQLDMIISANQKVISSTVYGDIKCTCRLSGTPDLTLSFTEASLIDDASLHRCIRINRFSKEKVVSFVPPDGSFTLLSYKVSGPSSAPIYIKPNITWHAGSGRVHVMVGNKNQHVKHGGLTGVCVIIPFPSITQNTSLSTDVGIIKFDQKTKVLRWEIGKLTKDQTAILEGSVHVLTGKIPDESPVIQAEWSCKQFTASGLKVSGLAVRQVNYKPFKGVLSRTLAGRNFELRTG